MRPLIGVVLGLPRAPGRRRVGDPGGDQLGRAGGGSVVVDGGPRHREGRLVAGRETERRSHGRALDRHGRARADRDLVGPAERTATALGLAEERAREPVLGPRRQLDDQLDLVLDAFRPAEDLVRRVQLDVMAALPFGERHRVGQPHAAGRRRERGFDHQRPGPIAAAHLVVVHRGGSTSGSRRDRAGGRRSPASRSAAGRASRSSHRASRARPRRSRRACRSRRSGRSPQCPGGGLRRRSHGGQGATVPARVTALRTPLRRSAVKLAPEPASRFLSPESSAIGGAVIGSKRTGSSRSGAGTCV
jgi:hypothetical protein